MRKSLGLGRNRRNAKPPDPLTVESTSKSFSGSTTQQGSSTNLDDTTVPTMDIPGNGNFGTLEVQQSFVQIPSEGPPTLATAAQQTGALSANASDQEIIPLDSLSQLIVDEKAMANDCLPGTSASVQSGPVKNSTKRTSDAKPVVSKKPKPSPKDPANNRSITDYFAKRVSLPLTPDNAVQSSPFDDSTEDDDEYEDITSNNTAEPLMSKIKRTRKTKFPVKGSKRYRQCQESWNIYKEVKEMISNHLHLGQKKRYKIIADRRNVSVQSIQQTYNKTLIRIEMSGKDITTDHPFDNNLLQILSLPQPEVEKFRKAKYTATNSIVDKDDEATGSSENVVAKPINRSNVSSSLKKGSANYNRLLSSWTVYQEIEMLRRSHPELETNPERYQFLATQQNVEFSSIKNKYESVQIRLNNIDKYVSIKHSLDDDLVKILNVPQNETKHQQRPPLFYHIKDRYEQLSVLKQELEHLELKQNVPEDEKFLYLAKQLNTSERVIRRRFVNIKVKECREMQITSSAMITDIRNKAISTLEQLAATELCTLKAREKMILSFFEPSIKPFAIQCTLQHSRFDPEISFNSYSRPELLQYVEEHFRHYHYNLYQSLDESASYPEVNETVHQIFSTVVKALNYMCMTSSLIVLSNISCMTAVFADAEKTFIENLTFDPFPSSLGVEVKNKWVFSFFSTSKTGNQFKCRLWHYCEKQKVVPSDVYFEDGTLLDRHLFLHLSKYHKIPTDYGATHDSYLDSRLSQTICLKSMPSETLDLITRLIDIQKLPVKTSEKGTIDASGTITRIKPLEISPKTDQELSSFVQTLTEDEFIVLCFFKPNDTNEREVICRMQHKRNGEFVKCSREAVINKTITLEALKKHIYGAHLVSVESRKSKTMAIVGRSIISLTQMPLDILEFYHRIAYGKFPKPKANQTSPITPFVKDLSLVVKPLSTSPTAWIEVATVKCMPSAYIKIAHFEDERMKVLSLNHNIRNLISRLNIHTYTNIARNYLVFLKTAANSVYDFTDTLLYTGFTGSKLIDARIIGYFRDVQQLIDGKQTFDQINNDKQKNEEMYAKMLECWKAGSDCFIQYMTENRWMTRKEALFNERAMIAALKWLPINCNRNHGMTANHSEVVDKNGITEEQITEIGIAELVTHYDRIKVDMQFAKPMNFSNADQPTRTPSPTPESLLSSGALRDMLVPPYSLVLKSVTDETTKLYSYHLFMSLFTLPPKDTNWFLSRIDSLQRADELDDMEFFEHMCSINTVMPYLSFDINQCVKWAQKVWHTVFIANVIAANKQLRKNVRHPVSKLAHKPSFDFICTSALLLAQVIGLKNADGAKYTDITSFAKQVTQFLNAEQTYCVKELQPFRKIVKFTDLAHLKVPPFKNYLQDPDSLTHLAVFPIDPFHDNPDFFKFYQTTFILRTFNFTGVLNKPLILSPLFKVPSFLWGSRFTRII